MENYKIVIVASVYKDLSKIDKQVVLRFSNKVAKLVENPMPRDSVKLSGHTVYRIRIGDYRFIYEIDSINNEIRVIKFGHRKDIYREF